MAQPRTTLSRRGTLAGALAAAECSIMLTSCGADLLPGERVLGDEVPAVVIDGHAGSRLGAAVAVGWLDDQLVVAAAAPDAGQVHVYAVDGSPLWTASGVTGLGRGLSLVNGRLLALAPGEGIVSLLADAQKLVIAAPQAKQVALCPDGSAVISTDAAAAVACGPKGQDLHTSCDVAGCQVVLDGATLDTTTTGSDVGFSAGVACWGDASLDDADAPGSLRCEDGRQILGLTGDHLGRTVASGYVAGVFNKWIVPARARIQPIAGGEVWVVDRAAEATRVAVAAAEGLVVVGVPGFASQSSGEGRVFIVDMAQAAPDVDAEVTW